MGQVNLNKTDVAAGLTTGKALTNLSYSSLNKLCCKQNYKKFYFIYIISRIIFYSINENYLNTKKP